MISFYGISTCDTCKKALKAIEAVGKDVTFRDVRSQPLTAAEIDAIVTEFGERVINRQFDDLPRICIPCGSQTRRRKLPHNPQ